MKVFMIFTGIAILASACHQNSASSDTHQAATDLLGENLKGQVMQIETETYLADSATGAMGKLDNKSTEKYNDSGYTVSYGSYTANDSATTLTAYDHNANGFITAITTTKNGKPMSSMKISVDSAGNFTAATSFDSMDKEDVYYDSISSNSFGQVLAAKGHHADSTLKMTFTNHFDSVYYVGGESKDSVGKLVYSSSIKLNDKKDPEEMKETNVTKDSTTKTTTGYTYNTWDKQGNWTQQTTMENGHPKKIVKRTITYKS